MTTKMKKTTKTTEKITNDFNYDYSIISNDDHGDEIVSDAKKATRITMMKIKITSRTTASRTITTTALQTTTLTLIVTITTVTKIRLTTRGLF